MEKFIKKNWIWLAITIVSIIVLVVVYFKGKSAGKQPHQIKIGEDIVGSPIPQGEVDKLKALTENIHADIHCVFCFRNENLYEQASNLSDNYLVALSNIYNEYFEVTDGETFYPASALSASAD